MDPQTAALGDPTGAVGKYSVVFSVRRRKRHSSGSNNRRTGIILTTVVEQKSGRILCIWRFRRLVECRDCPGLTAVGALVHDLKPYEVNDDSVELICMKLILEKHPAESALANARSPSNKHSTTPVIIIGVR